MSNKEVILFGLLFAVNAAAFLVMWKDKIASRKNNASRISEGILFFLTIAFGSVGIWAGMFTFRHKNQKWYFLIGVPLAAVQSSAAFYWVYTLIIGKN